MDWRFVVPDRPRHTGFLRWTGMRWTINTQSIQRRQMSNIGFAWNFATTVANFELGTERGFQFVYQCPCQIWSHALSRIMSPFKPAWVAIKQKKLGSEVVRGCIDARLITQPVKTKGSLDDCCNHRDPRPVFCRPTCSLETACLLVDVCITYR